MYFKSSTNVVVFAAPIDDADLPDLSDKQVESIFQHVESITLEPTINPFEPSSVGCFVKADFSGDPEEFGKRTGIQSCIQFCLKKKYTYAGFKVLLPHKEA